MEEVFYGPWDLKFFSRAADFEQRIVITGSDASDGAHLVPRVIHPGSGPGRVVGARWTLRAEWNDNAGSGWQPSALRKNAASYTDDDGLTVTIGIDDFTDAQRDHDYNDVLIVLRSLDPLLSPAPSTSPPLDFTISKKTWWHYWEVSGRDPENPYLGYPAPSYTEKD